MKILSSRVQPYLDGNVESFEKEIHKEADRLAAIPFGVPLLHIIGCAAAGRTCLWLLCAGRGQEGSCTVWLSTSRVASHPWEQRLTHPGGRRYGYARASRPKLGHAVEEWFTRVMHSMASQVPPASSNTPPLHRALYMHGDRRIQKIGRPPAPLLLLRQ